MVPGIAGSICLILALYALQTLPVNYAGVALLILAVILFVIETQVASGLLGLGGIIAFTLGSLMLIKDDFPYLQISRALIGGAVLTTTLFVSAAVFLVLKVRRRKAVSGTEAMIGQTATVKTNLDPKGQVLFSGEIWNAEPAGDERISEGEEVEIVSIKDLKLIVKRRTQR